MCGIAGGWNFGTGFDPIDGIHMAEAMACAINHRGPDDQGHHVDQAAGLFFSHRRLSILDVSERGKQPMSSADGRWTVVYNGEWYDHTNRRSLISDHVWRSDSDTETLVESISRFGIEETIASMNGMFAFAAWDKANRRLHIVRDRFGIKPVYLFRNHDWILFASELSALMAHPACPRKIDSRAVRAFLTLNYVPYPLSILEDVEKIEPGVHCVIHETGEVVKRRWYTLPLIEDKGTRLEGEVATNLIDSVLRDAVEKRMLSDVPLGSLLSGGIDSSLVTAYMQGASSTPIRTFSIGFPDNPDFDESTYARAVAEHLGTDHNELMVVADDILDIFPSIPSMFSEPMADSSQIPTHLLSRMARGHVTVALGGDGGDEVFAGYTNHPMAIGHRGPFRGPLSPLRYFVAASMRAVPIKAWDFLLGWLPSSRRPRYPGDWAHQRALQLSARNPVDAHIRSREHWYSARASSFGAIIGGEPNLLKTDPGPKYHNLDRIQTIDIRSYLVDDILTKVDIASMAVGLEVRVPFLDHRVVEAAMSLRTTERLSSKGRTKAVLRRILASHLPTDLFERPKRGFVLPLEDWFKGPLRDWIYSLVTRDSLASLGIDRPDPFLELVDRHMQGRGEYATPIWTLVSLLAWKSEWLPTANVDPLSN